jgi:predicted PurR-regulated permease PerM
VRWITRTIAAVGLVMLAVWLVRDFLMALTWAGLIAVTVWPIYGRFVLLIPAERDLLAPLLFTLLIGLVLIIPLTAALHQIALGSRIFVSTLSELQASGLPVPSWLARLPMAANTSIHGGGTISAIRRICASGLATSISKASRRGPAF